MGQRGQTGGRPAKPSLGQHFLSDAHAIRQIVDALGDVRERLVIEIGPGAGALTDLLARRARRLVAIELDRTLAPELARKYAGDAHVEILQRDVLQVDLTEVAAGERAIVVGNLPYYITSDILLHLMDHGAAIDFAVVMMQREVADRVTAGPGTREYGLLSASVQMAASARSLLTLPPGAFSPPPKVYSSVVQLMMRPRYEELGVERAEFEGFLKKCFAQKRKMLSKNLRVAGYPPERVAEAMAGAQISADARAEAISLEAMAALYRGLAL